MDVQLHELIDKIKRDGVASAEAEAGKIVSEAEKKAEQIVADARIKADEIIRDAKTETARMEKSGEDAIAQAGRNMLLTFRDSLVAELDNLIKARTSEAVTADVLRKLVPETVREWSRKSEVSELSVLLPPDELSELENALTSELKSEISAGLELKGDRTLSSGFRIGVRDGAAYYDYSAEAVAELFAAYLNPKVAALVKGAAEENNK